MKDKSKTKQALIQELISLRHKVSEQVQSESNASGRTQEEDLVPLLNQRLYVLIETIQKLAQVRDLEGIMAVVRSATRALVGADGSTFVLREGDQCFYADEDAISPLWKGHRFPMSMCISGWVMMNHQIAVIKDIYADARIPAEAYRPTFVKSLTMVPIRSRDPLGAIGNYWAYLHSPTSEEVQLLQTLADATAIAMENVRSYNEQEQRLTEHKKAEEKIKASLLEKETLLKEIHHRVKNNLQVISSLLGLQSSFIKDEESRKIFQDSQDRVKIMSQIHTMLYQSADLARIDFGRLIRELSHRLQQSYGTTGPPIEIHTDVTDVSLNIDTSIPCGLILNELVSNAVKYAFTGGSGGRIDISMKFEESRCILTIQDNGIGFPASIDFRNTQSLGLVLVNLLVGQMHGKIDMLADGGTTWTLTFPLKNDRQWQNG